MLTEEERRERERARKRLWRAKNREHLRECGRRDYQKNREKMLERGKRYRLNLTPEQKERKKERDRNWQRKFYIENRKAILEKKRGRKQSKEYAREYWLKNRERLLKKKKEHRHNHLEQYQAQDAVKSAVASGKLKRPDRCGKCGRKSRIEAHHYKGYDRKYWLNVRWLCRSCHRIEDAMNGYLIIQIMNVLSVKS